MGRALPSLTLLAAFCLETPFEAWILTPSFVYIVGYYWTLHLPSAMPVALLVALGLLQDIVVADGPFGSHAFLLMVLYISTLWLRTHVTSTEFSFIWLAFSSLMGLLCLVSWFLFSLHYSLFYPPFTFFIKYGVTSLWFPWISFFFGKFKYKVS